MDFKCRDEYINYSRPDITEKEISEVLKVLESGWLAKGPKSREFEAKFAEYVGAGYAVGMNSCTAALHVSLICAGIRPGDEVITVPMTFVSSANTIIHAGGTPVFVDIDPDSGCMDTAQIRNKITCRTKAIVPVHYAGQSCELDEIYDIADEYGLFVSEDAAHALHTKYKGNLIGHKPHDTVSYSFYATKNLCTGEGGMLVTDNEDIAVRARSLVSHGMSQDAWKRYTKSGSAKYDVTEIGYKYNMFDIQAALGLIQLERSEEMQYIREEYADIYDREFDNIEGIDYIKISENTTTHCRHLYIIKIDENIINISRDEFIVQLAERNVGTSIHFKPVHTMSIYKQLYGDMTGSFPESEKLYNSIISLPLYSVMTEEEIYYIVSAVKDVAEKFRK